jgi:hypothetical protein
MQRLTIGLMISIALATPALAEVSYLRCEVQTAYHRPAQHNSEFMHVENRYTKVFKLDEAVKMVSLYNERSNAYTPICSGSNQACKSSWNGQDISIDARGGADNPVPPYLDFRRAFKLSNGGKTVQLVIADYGPSATRDVQGGRANMYWTYDGACQPTAEPKGRAMRPPQGVGNPKYEKPTSPAKAVSKAEADQVMAGYYGNTMWGFSGGGHWFRMWFLDRNGLAYTSDDQDMTGEGKPRQWYIGKDSAGFRMCGEPIPAAGREGCYPLPVRTVGEWWVQHDMDGDAEFQLVPGRQ